VRGICSTCLELTEDCVCGQFKIKGRSLPTKHTRRAYADEVKATKVSDKSRARRKSERRYKGKDNVHGVPTTLPGFYAHS
jgi:hypothetical protein